MRVVASILWLFLWVAVEARAERLHWDWIQGDVYDVSLTSNTDIKVTSGDQQLHYRNSVVVLGRWTVTEVNAGNIARLRWHVQRIQIKSGQGDKQLTVDTELASKTEAERSLLATLRPLLDQRFELLVNDSARLLSVKELKRDSAGERPQRAPLGESQLQVPKLFDAAGVTQAFTHLFVEFPAGDLQVGTSWKKQPQFRQPQSDGETTYQYVGNENGSHRIRVSGNVLFPNSEEMSVEVKRQQVAGSLLVKQQPAYISQVAVSLQLETETDDRGTKVNVIQSDSEKIEVKKLLP